MPSERHTAPHALPCCFQQPRPSSYPTSEIAEGAEPTGEEDASQERPAIRPRVTRRASQTYPSARTTGFVTQRIGPLLPRNAREGQRIRRDSAEICRDSLTRSETLLSFERERSLATFELLTLDNAGTANFRLIPAESGFSACQRKRPDTGSGLFHNPIPEDLYSAASLFGDSR